MPTALRILAVTVAGTAIGFFATWLTVVRSMPGDVTDGPWRTSLSIGNVQGDPYTRARTALHGLFALSRSETIYYTAVTDDGGRPLDGRCRYRLSGPDPDARWWSITTYGADDFLIPNPAGRYSVSKTNVVRDKSGTFSLQLGGPQGGANWIPAGAGRFSLTLRLYNPAPDVALDPAHAVLPAIEKGSCP